jgi:hypothetical protein
MVVLTLSMVFAFVCADCPGPGPVKMQEIQFYWPKDDNTIGPDIVPGSWGDLLKIVARINTGQELEFKYVFSGPGELFFAPDNYNQYYGNEYFFAQPLVPVDLSKIYSAKNDHIVAIYRPPANEDVPPEGITVTLGCEVFSPYSNQWLVEKRGFIITPRQNPMLDFPLEANTSNTATVPSGKTHKFSFRIGPRTAENIQMQYYLKTADDYWGDQGKLLVKEGCEWSINRWNLFDYSVEYTAPDDITSTLTVIAKFSIYDPLMKQKREGEYIFYVVPDR